MANAIIIDSRDTVATLAQHAGSGDAVLLPEGGQLIATDDIPAYHKIAIKDMIQGEQVVKYGQHIGIASQDIKKGQHVHVHNVESHREDLREASL